MYAILDQFEEAVQELEQSAEQGGSYLDRYSAGNNIYEQINKEERQLIEIRRMVADRAKVLSKLTKKQNTYIYDHPLFKTTKADQIVQRGPVYSSEEEGIWEKYLKINHQIVIEVSIESLQPFIRHWGNIQNELTFSNIRFHLHHIDKVDSSKLLTFTPQHNLHHRSQLVNGKMLAGQKRFGLRVVHKIRNQNISLYRELFEKQRIVIAAESQYGAIVGFAQINIDDMTNNNQMIQNQFRVLIFRRVNKEGDQEINGKEVFSAKSHITLESNPIAPELKQLNEFAKMEDNKRPHSRSPSPNRAISRSPKDRSGSPKLKRKMVGNIVKGPTGTIWLTIYDNWQYRYSLQHLNPTLSRELVYKNMVNVSDKKVELIKVEGRYYLKMCVRKEKAAEPSSMVFNLSQLTFSVSIINNSLLQVFDFEHYENKLKKQSSTPKNKLIYLGDGNYTYLRQHHRLLKNIVRQHLEDCILSHIFIKTPLGKCQIYCNKPFTMTQIIHKEDGYWINYYYEADSVIGQLSTILIFYLRNASTNHNEIHLFDCSVKQRQYTRQTLSRQIQVKEGENFIDLSMKMILHENYEYNIRSIDKTKLAVVNGTNFKYQNVTNQLLTFQVLKKEESLWHVDLIFYDHKNRCFTMRLFVRPQQKLYK